MEENIKRQIDLILDSPCLFLDKSRKSREQRECELVYWYEKYNEVNEVYNFYGMDCIDSAPIDEWLDRGLFRKQRHDINASFYPNGSKFPVDYTVIMRDKRMFEGFCESVLGYANKYSPSIGLVVEGTMFVKDQGSQILDIDFQKFISRHVGEKLVFKQVFGCSGEVVLVVDVIDGFIKWKNKDYTFNEFFDYLTSIKATNWIVQRFIKQHPIMNRLNETSVNTLRIVTFNVGDNIFVAPVVMRYGYPGAVVDNSSRCVKLDENGVVDEYAYDFVNKKRFECHEKGLQIPYFKEAIEFAKNMHLAIPEIFTIGWDVCITPEGPHLIEGNDGWDPWLTQFPIGNQMRSVWNELVDLRNKYYNKKI